MYGICHDHTRNVSHPKSSVSVTSRACLVCVPNGSGKKEWRRQQSVESNYQDPDHVSNQIPDMVKGLSMDCRLCSQSCVDMC
jgi:hypothetical protein